MDDLDRQLLNLMQEQIPLVDRPFAALGARLGLSEQQVLDRIHALKAPPSPIIRQVSAIFDTRALGYQSSLVAAKIDPARIERAAEVINQHPGVTHNYQRNHAYNLWYTVAVPPDSHFGLEKTVELLHQQSGAAVTRLFPTLRLYKIGVNFDLTGSTDAAARSEKPRFTEQHRRQAMNHTVTDADKAIIRVLQQDLPIVPRPFDLWAAQADVPANELLIKAGEYLEQNRMRRFSAVLHHREAGFAANGMGAWNVPPDRRDEFGAMAATFAAVSHCYLRPTYEDWPYSIFTMVHGTSEDECHAALAAISQATGIVDYAALFSTREFKKTRLRYFAGDVEAWEQDVKV
jgi:siroheme decarboxylase